jgi:uncharacterized repeat protein (TIGR03803 family)
MLLRLEVFSRQPRKSRAGFSNALRRSVAVLALSPMLSPFAWPQVTEKVLYSFKGGSDGAGPDCTLIFDSVGNLYGSTGTGGANGEGTVFKLAPSSGGWKKTILHSFGGSDGYSPTGLIFDTTGNLYGTTGGGGANGDGTVYRLTPSNGGWIESVLHSFAGSDGSYPQAGLVLDTAGNLYGTTKQGGASGFGTVFELKPSSGAWTETVLHSFTVSDGIDPEASLIFDGSDNLYGTTLGGGAYGGGTVFELKHSNGGWTEATLYSFPGNVGYALEANVVFDSEGNLLGTTAQGPGVDCNTVGCGIVFELSPPGSWIETTLHAFIGSDGERPLAGVILDSQGNLYGTTWLGGANGFGSVFKLDTSNKETVLHSFSGGIDGSGPFAGLVMDAAGNLYGTTAAGGSTGNGVVFEITGAISTSPWHPLKNKAQFDASTPLLLTDGTVMIQQYCSPNWWQLIPDSKGQYATGTWTKTLAPSPYGPLYYASAVLPDGSVIIEGGEYAGNGMSCPEKETNMGAIFTPPPYWTGGSGTWATVQPPTEGNPPVPWPTIGDAASVVLPNGLFMIGNCCNANDTSQALTRTSAGWIITDKGKADANSEEGWTLLPDGQVLTVDVWNSPNTELYNPSPVPGSWSSAGSTPVQIIDTLNHEVGPAILQPNGAVFATGATGNNAIYNLATSTWSAGPSFPFNYANLQLAIPDGPAVLLPTGNVLVETSPVIETVNGKAYYSAGSDFFEFNGETLTLTAVPGPPNARNDPAYSGRMLLLPNGQVLFTDGTDEVEIYTPSGTNYGGDPVITSSPPTIAPNQTYKITGTQFNGLSQAVAYGDDYQAATNYPLVRITNNATQDVFYARTHDHSTMAIATGGLPVSTYFDTPTTLETGASTLQVVANGIASAPVAVNVQ